MFIFYVTSYGIQFTRAISICESKTQGELVRLCTVIFCLIMGYLQGDLIEDFVFGDLGRWGGVWHNWSFFMPPGLIVILGYTQMHHLHGHSELGAWREAQSPIIDSVMQTGKSPLHWPVVLYEQNESELFSIVLMANLVYGLTTFYYQMCWKSSIKMSKNEF